MEEKGETPKVGVTFETAQPTFAHMALVALERAGAFLDIITNSLGNKIIHAKKLSSLKVLTTCDINCYPFTSFSEAKYIIT